MGCWEERAPALTMLAVDVGLAATNTLIKKAINDGLNRLVLITLRQLVATLIMAPIAFFLERKTRPKLTLEACLYIFFSALFGLALAQYLFFFGMQYASATFACAFLNMTPIFTFLIALASRLETLNVKSKAGILKIMGTIICIFGVAVLTLYRGASLTNSSHASSAISVHQPLHAPGYSKGKWLASSFALIAGSLSWSLWFPLQSKLNNLYPALNSATSLIFLVSFIQAAALSLYTQRSLSVWILRSKLDIVTVLFSGIVGSGICFFAMSWCVKKKGPVFTAAFTPMMQVMVAIVDYSILHEQIHLGSIVGSALVISGLYFLLWGKSKETGSSEIKPREIIADSHKENQTQLQIV